MAETKKNGCDPHLLARDYLATLHATQTGTDQDELYTVLVYLHDLITFDEKENGGR